MSGFKYQGPIVLAIMDGVGIRASKRGNAVLRAHTGFICHALTHHYSLPLAASGEAVGLLPGTMGNSEVGHNTIGAGQIPKQGIARIQTAFDSGDIWLSKAWQDAIKQVKKNHSTLHFSGIFSDGQVHSSIDHLFAMIKEAHQLGIKRIRVHAVLDGRDVAPQSAEIYLQKFQKFINTFPDQPDYKIASAGGRMVFVADRYESDWSIVEAGWRAMVEGKAEHQFEDPNTAIASLRAKNPNLQDQYFPPFVISENNQPIGKIKSGDSLIYFDFRADRAVEITEAFTATKFTHFKRGKFQPESIYFAGLSEYDSDRHLPKNHLVPPLKIANTLNQFLASKQISQLAISETVKFGHITYYFNGNSYTKAKNEKHLELPSDQVPFNQRPWMQSAQIADQVIANLEKFDFIRVNFPGGDMVGHFAELEPTILALEAIDLQLARIAKEVDRLGGAMIITSDHGNAEELIDSHGNPKTSHTTNPVPCIFYDNTLNAKHRAISRLKKPGLANLAATIAVMLGATDYPSSWQAPLIRPKSS